MVLCCVALVFIFRSLFLILESIKDDFFFLTIKTRLAKVETKVLLTILVQLLDNCNFVCRIYLCQCYIGLPFPQVTGVALLAVGLWWKFMLGPYMLLISNSPSNAPYALTGTGIAIVLFGLFGCFATCRGRPWMLKLVIL